MTSREVNAFVSGGLSKVLARLGISKYSFNFDYDLDSRLVAGSAGVRVRQVEDSRISVEFDCDAFEDEGHLADVLEREIPLAMADYSPGKWHRCDRCKRQKADVKADAQAKTMICDDCWAKQPPIEPPKARFEWRGGEK